MLSQTDACPLQWNQTKHRTNAVRLTGGALKHHRSLCVGGKSNIYVRGTTHLLLCNSEPVKHLHDAGAGYE